VAVTSLPTWAVYALAFGSPALTAIIALIGQHLSRRGAKELEKRSRREEIMRILRWAAELAVSDDVSKARLGVQNIPSGQDRRIAYGRDSADSNREERHPRSETVIKLLSSIGLCLCAIFAWSELRILTYIGQFCYCDKIGGFLCPPCPCVDLP
jgi:hypothetical protein